MTKIKINPTKLSVYIKLVSGFFYASRGETLTEIDIKIIYAVKQYFKANATSYLDKNLRKYLISLLNLQPQTLYNRLSDLKKKGVIVPVNKKLTLHQLFSDDVTLIITYESTEDSNR
jgi:hypothetical protein